MPLPLQPDAPTLLLCRSAYERAGLVRNSFDERLGLTADEFRVEGELIVIGPVYDAEAFATLLEELERLGLVYYDDFFELSGGWPDWLTVFVGSVTEPGRSKPSQPQR